MSCLTRAPLRGGRVTGVDRRGSQLTFARVSALDHIGRGIAGGNVSASTTASSMSVSVI
jgi:hypothetical protein